MRRELVQPAADDGRAGLGQGGEAGVGGDDQVLVRLRGVQAGPGVGGRRGGEGLSHRAVALGVGGVAGGV